MQDHASELRERFRDVITSEAEIRAIAGDVHERAVAKVVNVIDEHSRRFIAASPFVFIATWATTAPPRSRPRATRPASSEGARRAHPRHPRPPRQPPLRHLPQPPPNPAVGLIFLIPGITYTLRVSGTALIVRDPDLRAASPSAASSPTTSSSSSVRRVLTHCPKCMIRSGLWTPEAWPDTTDVPSFAETLDRPRPARRKRRRGRGLHRRRQPRPPLLIPPRIPAGRLAAAFPPR